MNGLMFLSVQAASYGVISASDDEEKCTILDKFFPLEACYFCSDVSSLI